MRRLIRYAGWEPPASTNSRRIPVERAEELRNQGMGWKEVAWQLTEEFGRDLPFTADGVQSAVTRWKKATARDLT